MKNFIIFVLVLAFSVSFAAIRTVNLVNNRFAPETLSVMVGDTVRWINIDLSIHTTTSGVNGVANDVWNSGNLAQNDSFQYVFTSTGNYPYFCIPYYLMGMSGIVNVNAVSVKEAVVPLRTVPATQIYPNPFNKYTAINYQIAEPGQVEVKIFDAVGKPVKQLVNKYQSAGFHDIIWNGTNHDNQEVQNGLYFYRVKYNGANYTGKILKTD